MNIHNFRYSHTSIEYKNYLYLKKKLKENVRDISVIKKFNVKKTMKKRAPGTKNCVSWPCAYCTIAPPAVAALLIVNV